ncbi:phosphotransferase family protein [Phytohabitans rumicis]|uniref:Aminoglycoside phosphotransferase domain-containing protein n=1 Tax=Phytohabitans rumicis TaxID=1076125 RepID=A0A6V8L450_9ACTN|nr:phosphotransferase [Phytohabitans rumicis]GFJ92032.1 hypothetical protein Prum_056740 [Phytohabitans rumicis]
MIRADLSWWREIATGRETMPAAPPWVEKQLDDLVALEAALPEYTRTTAATHCDLRLDNVLIDPGGAAWLCDWNWICAGPAWFDTASLLVSAYASGLDADALFAAHPTTQDAPADALDATLAALSGYLLTRPTHTGASPTWPPTTAGPPKPPCPGWPPATAGDPLSPRLSRLSRLSPVTSPRLSPVIREWLWRVAARQGRKSLITGILWAFWPPAGGLVGWPFVRGDAPTPQP